MKIQEMSDKAILSTLGQRLRQLRLDADQSRRALADDIGLSPDTVRNAESGQNVSLESIVRILRGLNSLQSLESFLETTGPSPVELARASGKLRRRASGKRTRAAKGEWKW